jgi:hypothetical protein
VTQQEFGRYRLLTRLAVGAWAKYGVVDTEKAAQVSRMMAAVETLRADRNSLAPSGALSPRQGIPALERWCPVGEDIEGLADVRLVMSLNCGLTPYRAVCDPGHTRTPSRDHGLIVPTPSDSATYARTQPAKMQVSTALGAVFLLISGLGVRFPRGAQDST